MNNIDTLNDFTVQHYRELLKLAKSKYRFIKYEDVFDSQCFVLWRHDCDFSLNRALSLAKIENEEGVVSTYFLNPHCNHNNLLEKPQSEIIKKILDLGHEIGLHFDAEYYNLETEDQFETLVKKEASWLEDWFGRKISVFSFHNPTKFLLSCNQDTYGGLVNCYSKSIQTKTFYVSDSNGYWRFGRLWDVLEQAEKTCLQVLTHPDWWQIEPMYPRQRFFRSVYGRAEATMHQYDEDLSNFGRINLRGKADALQFLEELNTSTYELCDYLWNKAYFNNLFVELWRLYESQVFRLCKAWIIKAWKVPVVEVNTFFDNPELRSDSRSLFISVFGDVPKGFSGSSSKYFEDCLQKRNQLIDGHGLIVTDLALEEDCVFICEVVRELSEWGIKNPNLNYDGVSPLDEMEFINQKESVETLAVHPSNLADSVEWNQFKNKINTKG